MVYRINQTQQAYLVVVAGLEILLIYNPMVLLLFRNDKDHRQHQHSLPQAQQRLQGLVDQEYLAGLRLVATMDYLVYLE